ncbi:MAG: hypothetical protein SPJ97_02230 [Bacteroides sp.]|nr:hypothetical protein [Bacteroides sp.]
MGKYKNLGGQAWVTAHQTLVPSIPAMGEDDERQGHPIADFAKDGGERFVGFGLYPYFCPAYNFYV